MLHNVSAQIICWGFRLRIYYGRGSLGLKIYSRRDCDHPYDINEYATPKTENKTCLICFCIKLKINKQNKKRKKMCFETGKYCNACKDTPVCMIHEDELDAKN